MRSTAISHVKDVDSGRLPEVAYSRSGVVFNPREDVWRFRDAVNDVRLSFDDLPISDLLKTSLKKTLLWYMQSRASSSAMSHLSGFRAFCIFVKKDEGSIIGSIDENALISYRASLSVNQKWRFGGLSTLLRKWVGMSLPGVTNVAAKLLSDLRNPGVQKGKSILNSDPNHGPLNDIEFQQVSSALKKAYRDDVLPLSDYVLLLLVMGLGQRPVQYASLKVCDVCRIEEGSGPINYLLRMPRAKQKLQLARSQFTNRLLNPELGKYVWAHSQNVRKRYSRLISNVEECPLFPDPLHDRHNYLPGFEFHQTSQELGVHVKQIANRLQVISPRTGARINLTTYRFRRTTGTRAAQEGYGELAIAALLDHTDTQNVGVYIEALPDIVRRIDKAIALQIAPLAQAFAGKLVDREQDAERGDDPASRITSPAIDAKPMGSCGSYGFCKALAPLACYTCRDFQPWREGPHEAVLDYLLAERERLGKSADMRIAAVEDQTIYAVAEVILLCRRQLQGEKNG